MTQRCTGCRVLCAWNPSYHTLLPPRTIVECITLSWNIICNIFQLRTGLGLLRNFLSGGCRDKAWKTAQSLGLILDFSPSEAEVLPAWFPSPPHGLFAQWYLCLSYWVPQPKSLWPAAPSPCGHDKSPKVWKEGTSQVISMIALLSKDPVSALWGSNQSRASFSVHLCHQFSLRVDGERCQNPNLQQHRGQECSPHRR